MVSDSECEYQEAANANEEQEEERVGEEEEDHEARNPKRVTNVKEPTNEERESHAVGGHVQYRSWCAGCVSGRGHTRLHKSIVAERAEDEVPVVSIDYGFFGKRTADEQEEGKTQVVFLAVKDRKTKAIAAHAMPCKGRGDGYPVERVVRTLDEWGRADIALKSDGEPAIKDLERAIKMRRGEDTQLEEAPRGEHQANGEVERAVGEIAGMVRTLKVELEKRIGEKIATMRPIVKWMVEYSGAMVTRFRIGEDGKTAYERLKGRKFKKELVEFGESVMYEVYETKAKKDKSEDRFRVGTYVGFKTNSHEYWVATEAGDVTKTNTIKRRPPSERWNAEAVRGVRGVPWDTGEKKARVSQEMLEEEKEALDVPVEQVIQPKVRAFKITRLALDRFEYTPLCPGCETAQGKRQQGTHTLECRRRLEKAMGEDDRYAEKIQSARDRQNEGIASRIEKTAEGESGEKSRKRNGEASSSSGLRRDERETAAHEQRTAEMDVDRNDGGVIKPSSPTVTVEGMEVETGDTEMGGADAEGADQRGTKRQREDEKEDMEIAYIAEKFGKPRPDVAEMYSAPRVTAEAKDMGLRPGFAMDLTTVDEEGNPWDFSIKAQRQKARERVEKERPMLLIGSPMCRMFSALQNLSKEKRDEEKWRREYVQALVHLNFCAELYEMQWQAGRYFLHEHPAGATSWRTKKIQELEKLEGVLRVVGHMCRHGMKSKDENGEGLVLKPTGWLTNCEEVAKEVARTCTNLKGRKIGELHRHVTLVSGRAKAAEVYPRALCRAILRGLRRQLTKDGVMEENGVGVICQVAEETEWKHWSDEKYKNPHEDEQKSIYDEVSGAKLDPERVAKAHEDELEFIDKKPLYEIRTTAEAWQVTGSAPISTRWINIDKGGPGEPEYRSRWVARQFRDSKTGEFFAATPPWETLKMVLSLAASQKKPKGRHQRRRQTGRWRRGVSILSHWLTNRKRSGNLKIDLLDISRAHFNAKPKEPTYVELPEERRIPGMCAKLIYNLYGTRGAAQAWEEHYGENMKKWGFEQGKGCTCVFVHHEKEIITVVHGDDFTSLGNDEALDWLHEKLAGEYEFKKKARLGPDEGDDKSARLLNRVISWEKDGIALEADQRHVEIVLKQLGLEGGRAVGTPGTKERETEDGDDEELGPEEKTAYRGVAARLNFVAMDRADIQYSTKEACRAMARPTRGAWKLVKRIGRYLKGAPRMVQKFKFQETPDEILVTVDSDYAGCKQTRRSTSGGVVRLGGHTIKTWSSTQAIVSLSSGEAEYYAMLKGGCVGLGVRSLAEDIGMQLDVRLQTDSAAAKGVANRMGLGKTRHIAVCFLWLQEQVRHGEILIEKIDGDKNAADLMTKHLSKEIGERHAEAVGLEKREGRHEKALKVSQ